MRGLESKAFVPASPVAMVLMIVMVLMPAIAGKRSP